MSGPILAIIFSGLGVMIIQYIIIKKKGINSKYIATGMVLIFFPYSIQIGFSEGQEVIINIIRLITVLIGFTILMFEFPKAD